MPIFQHQQINFHYELSGTGPPVVFCHGLTGDLGQIRELLGDLPEHRLVLWDARGHGSTEPVGPEEAYTFPRFAADLHALFNHLEIERAVVGGVSMGAGVATRFALDWPEAISALILVRPAWLDQPLPPTLKHCVQIGELLARFSPPEARRQFERSREYEQLMAIDAYAARQFCEQFDKPLAAERSVRLRRMPASCPIQSRNETSQLKMPALVVGCQSDYVHPYQFSVQWSQRLPHTSLVSATSKSTDVQKHNQDVRDAIVRFLNRTIS